MDSVMDMLAGVPMENNEEEVPEEDTAEEIAEKDKPKDIFNLSEDDDDGENIPENINPFYTAPIDVEPHKKSKPEEKHVSPKKSKNYDKNTLDNLGKHLLLEDNDSDGNKTEQSWEFKEATKSSQPAESSEDEDGDTDEEEGTKPTEVVTVKVTPQDKPEIMEEQGDEEVDDSDGPKYCHCRWGESGVMLECENCSEWYHDECIGLMEEETENIDTYFCATCCSKNPTLIIRYKEDPIKFRNRLLKKKKMEEVCEPESPPPSPPRKRAKKAPEKKKNKILNRIPSPKSTPVYNLSSGNEDEGNQSSDNNKSDKEYKAEADLDSVDDVEKEIKMPVKKVKKLRRTKKEEKVAFVICDECGDSFPNKKALLRHSRKHIEQDETRYECEECSKTFASSKALRDHEMIHTGIKPYSCMFCGESFFTMTQLSMHTNNKHLNVRHQCEHCNRSYSNKATLMLHMKKIHNEEVDSD